MKQIVLISLISVMVTGCNGDGDSYSLPASKTDCTTIQTETGVTVDCGDGETTIENGTDGADGKDGTDGKLGERGTDGVNGSSGEKGEPGTDGKDGTDGKHGADGENGRSGSNGSNGDDGEDGQTSLITNTTFKKSDDCPDGGTRIDTGLDSNSNGKLEKKEITSSTELCDSSDNGEPETDDSDEDKDKCQKYQDKYEESGEEKDLDKYQKCLDKEYGNDEESDDDN